MLLCIDELKAVVCMLVLEDEKNLEDVGLEIVEDSEVLERWETLDKE